MMRSVMFAVAAGRFVPPRLLTDAHFAKAPDAAMNTKIGTARCATGRAGRWGGLRMSDTLSDAPRVPCIASCIRGFERVVPAPEDWDVKPILVWSSAWDTEPFFPECVECDPEDHSITISPDDEGVFHRIKVCTISFREEDI